ncbi:MAG: ABC transporter ATP-binding protein [Betaproteobacteria bacterium RIFCSPLOWO2_02_FULL_65_24]|nr:MAG: ABC transporter ATP-binding protein [Betaproteobacteria bacterium RIFCSPLOWO2_02_FULL_65_24]OGA96847.1 MAG: ABC transporter ATP-binding protein [Betaproteobacteria bacterium RIFCSPLOWO2_12_FULL_66_14]
MSLLEINALEVRYGGIQAVKGVDLVVDRGELICLIGANGAGKSSTLRAISGLVPAARGGVRYAGRDLSRARAFERARAGLALVPEGRGVFAQLTVDENLSMGAYSRRAAEAEQVRRRVFGLFPRLNERRRQIAGTLSGGEQQMLAIGRALMSGPELLLLDEPSMGLAPLAVQRIFEVIRAINAEGVSILLVEQNARVALGLASRAYVMESGRIVLSGDARAMLDNPRVKEAYLGEAL